MFHVFDLADVFFCAVAGSYHVFRKWTECFSVNGQELSLIHISVYLEIAMKQYEDIRFAGYYNVGPDDADCVTTGTLTDLFCQAWGDGQTWIDRYDGGPHEANFLKLDCSKIKKVFGWTPRYHVKEAVEKTI